MIKTLALAATLASLPAWDGAQVQGPVAPAAAWKKLLATAVAEGTLTPAANGSSGFYSLEEEITDPGGRLMTFKVTVLTGTPAGAPVKTGRVLLAYSEIYSLADGSASHQGWYVEVSAAGQVEKVTRTKGMTRAAKTVRDPAVTMALDDPEVRAMFTDLVEFWTSRTFRATLSPPSPAPAAAPAASSTSRRPR